MTVDDIKRLQDIVDQLKKRLDESSNLCNFSMGRKAGIREALQLIESLGVTK